MRDEAKQPTVDTPRQISRLDIITIADGTEMQRRIAGALAEPDLQAFAQIDTPQELVDFAIDASTVIVFACNIDAPREIASLRRLRREAHHAAIVVISPSVTGTGVRRALDAGANGLVFDPELVRTLATTVRAVAIGQSVVPGEFRASIERPVLSHREQQVLTLVRRGLTNAQIADRLYLAESTIKSHLSSIFTKFGVRSRKEVAAAVIDVEPALETAISAAGSGPSGQASA